MLQTDSTFIHVAYVVIGLIALLAGGEFLVRGAVWIARHLGVSVLFVGLVVVGFGTSAPELAVTLNAALTNKPELALGNVVGSNIANILLILGVSAMIHTLVFSTAAVKRETLLMLAASFLFFALAQFNQLNLWTGIFFLLLLVSFLTWSYRTEMAAARSPERKLHEKEAEEFYDKTQGLPLHIVMTIGGIVCVVVGAQVLVEGAVSIARTIGVSEAAIGLTMVAVGTSLPELATAVVAAYRKHTDVIVGNIIGSNIFNILAILGTTLLVSPIPVSEDFFYDLIFFMAATLAVVPFLLTLGRIHFSTGLVFLVTYGIFITLHY